ncbi:hypothetical protein ACHHYP_01918 [Achlya hypogyna]|uniref:Wbp11/ELF5/Saf1 N-terminal domain-containing protein n=1 Tax=Achlya hypogyna TaxID=1202772 RepID=A0A1V9Z7N3_ACHHY|nr:hypothetical protein ACHHYP_01918 [Achlya hypogyna]
MAKDKLSAAPLDAYRKEQKKKEKKAVKDRREHVKQTKSEHVDVQALQEKIRKLERDEESGRLDGAGRKRKQELEDTLRLAKKKKADAEAEAKAREAAQPKSKKELDALNKEKYKNPEQSIHYHPIFNPYGVAPPGFNADGPNPFTNTAMRNSIVGQPPLPLAPRPRMKIKNRPPLPKGPPPFRPPPPPPSTGMRPPPPPVQSTHPPMVAGMPPPPPPPMTSFPPPPPPPLVGIPGPPLRPPPMPTQVPPPPPAESDDDELRVRSLVPAALRVQRAAKAKGAPRPPPPPTAPGLSFMPVPMAPPRPPPPATAEFNSFLAEMKDLGAM